jgi:hypothetical protein
VLAQCRHWRGPEGIAATRAAPIRRRQARQARFRQNNCVDTVNSLGLSVKTQITAQIQLFEAIRLKRSHSPPNRWIGAAICELCCEEHEITVFSQLFRVFRRQAEQIACRIGQQTETKFESSLIMNPFEYKMVLNISLF